MTSSSIAESHDVMLVTGANGFIGTRVVHVLLQRGFTNIRCFVRPSSRLDRLEQVVKDAGSDASIQLIRGDLTSPRDCSRAASDVRVVFHLAAGFDKSFAGAYANSAVSTRNLMDACLQQGTLRRFTNVSSFSVYSNLNMKRGALVEETSPLEDAPQERYDAYTFGKLKQEEIVCEYGRDRGLPYVILRPGTVYGEGKRDLTGRIGVSAFGVLLHVGGSNLLPLTFVDNCADAIVLAGLRPGLDGEVFNVVDDELLTSAQFLRAYKKETGTTSIRVPYFLAYFLCAMWEGCSRHSKGRLRPAFNRRRCAAEWKGNRFSNQKLRDRVGWAPGVGVDEGMRRFLSQFASRSA